MIKKKPKEHEECDKLKSRASTKLHVIYGDRNANNTAGSGRMGKDVLLLN